MDFVRGDDTGLMIPAHMEALRAGGAVFLTEAFRLFGSISPSNRVVGITRFEICPGGSTGQKLFLSVAYEQAERGLHTDLFVKFSRDFDDPIRDDRGKHEMESEARFAAISRLPDFPITVPVAYFADYHHESRTGVLITQSIAFGTDGIEPHHRKCLDHDIGEPIAHYRAIVSALARIAAAHRGGRLSPDITERFPFDPRQPAEIPIPYDRETLHRLVRDYAAFAVDYPQLLPSTVRAPSFITKFDRDVGRLFDHQDEIRCFLVSNPDLIALCHWNANIDNAWFWRDGSGALQCGLIDWGRVNQMNLAFSLWGSLSAAHHDVWDRHLGELLTLFVEEYAGGGGPLVDIEELRLHLDLYVAMMGLSYFIEAPARILFRLPEAAEAAGPLDPVFRECDPARNNLHIFTVLLKLWQKHDFGASLDRMLERLSASKAGTD